MPYIAPSGVIETLEKYDKIGMFHIDPTCPQIAEGAVVTAAPRPGSAQRCRRCASFGDDED